MTPQGGQGGKKMGRILYGRFSETFFSNIDLC